MIAILLQADSAWEDRAENYARVAAMLDAAAPPAGSLVVLPELFDTGFSFNLARTADGDGATLSFLRETARRHRITLHGSRSVIGPDQRGRNRATICGPEGTVLCEYDKIHPFSFGREPEFFTGGDSVLTYRGDDGTDSTIVCPAICYDLRFPELFRRGLQMGAEVFALGANWPAPRALHRRALLLARAIENQAFVLGVNRAGADPHLTYSGESVAFGPRGETLAELGDGPIAQSVSIDLADLREWRARFPAWRDARLLSPC
ncbi:MAG: nitrilase-related carbon-nitrogen hydrolase [Phycisphaerales bacterium]